ncbi:HofP DNA utilization family protein [Kosakonia sp. BYX6]|uniref:HofP DNA utilization family protein n=1 Tax=Kosakonia calanthes TaxID=3139408 RepID=A0ABZ3B5P2_9ENTR
MTAKRLLFAGGLCLLLCGMRDPFQPLPDVCQIAQLNAWQFHGVVQGGQKIGIVSDAAGRWHRVVAGETLPSGWRIISVNPQEIDVATGKECAPSTWRWKRKGTQHAKMDSEHRAL